MKKVLALLSVALLMCVAVSSCQEDPAEDSPIVGRWKLVKINGSDVVSNDLVDYYVFNVDGTGSWAYYQAGSLHQDLFSWSSYSNDYVEIKYSDGVENSFYYRFNGVNLEMSEYGDFKNYTTYAPY